MAKLFLVVPDGIVKGNGHTLRSLGCSDWTLGKTSSPSEYAVLEEVTWRGTLGIRLGKIAAELSVLMI